jgi:hypothetical protein
MLSHGLLLHPGSPISYLRPAFFQRVPRPRVEKRQYLLFLDSTIIS